MRIFMLAVLAIAFSGCAMPPKQPSQDPAARKELSARVDGICALPAAEREAELAKLKKDTGMVLFCGDTKKAEEPPPK